MILRALLETLIGLLITALLALIAGGLLQLESGWQTAFFDEGPRFIAGFFSIGGILWAILLIIGNLANRARGSGWKFLTNTVSLLIAAIVNVIVWAVIGFSSGGWGTLVVALGLVASVIVLVAGAVAMALTHFAIFRRNQSRNLIRE